jgi:hypothetical protein
MRGLRKLLDRLGAIFMLIDGNSFSELTRVTAIRCCSSLGCSSGPATAKQLFNGMLIKSGIRGVSERN